MIILTHSEKDMVQLACACHAVWHTKPFTCWLTGDLGAGKTTFVRAYLRACGVTGTIKSPTFGLIEHYPLPQCSVMHMDLYRLSEHETLWALDIPDLLEQHTCFVEWPSLLQELGMQPNVHLTLTVRKDGVHQVVIKADQKLLPNSSVTD